MKKPLALASGFFNEVCLAAREVMLCIVKLLRSEVPVGVSGTLNFTLRHRRKTSLWRKP